MPAFGREPEALRKYRQARLAAESLGRSSKSKGKVKRENTKQSQFARRLNEPNLNNDKWLREYAYSRTAKKQSQSKPISYIVWRMSYGVWRRARVREHDLKKQSQFAEG